MEIHNTMEDIVVKYLNEILALKDNVCKCEQCRLDMICYALNRVRPMYLASSRGIIHTENDDREQKQEKIDVYMVVANAIKVVSELRRHEVDRDYNYSAFDFAKSSKELRAKDGFFYNFPQIVGRIFDSSILEPLSEVTISLFNDTGKKLAPMSNPSWENPLQIVPQMQGTFTFWPKSIEAEKNGLQKDFNFNIKIEKDGFEILYKVFYIRVISSKDLDLHIQKEKMFYLNDIFLKPINNDE